MKCDKCGGAMWDNTEDKKSPKHPDYKCKDKECGHAVWLDKKASGAKAANGNGAAVPKAEPGGPSRTASPLAPVYMEALVAAKGIVAASGLKGTTAENVLSVAACLFIEHNKSERPITAKAEKPVAAKPRVTVPDDEFPPALEDGPDNLPF